MIWSGLDDGKRLSLQCDVASYRGRGKSQLGGLDENGANLHKRSLAALPECDLFFGIVISY